MNSFVDCTQALSAIEADPLNITPELHSHLRQCPACNEARVWYLAQEDYPTTTAPEGYFDQLHDRILRKLPAKKIAPLHQIPLAFWLAAAVLLLAVGTGGFIAGRVNRPPTLEAYADIPEAPFLDEDEALIQIQNLNPEELKALLKHLETPHQP